MAQEKNGTAQPRNAPRKFVICILINYAIHDNFIFVFFIII